MEVQPISFTPVKHVNVQQRVTFKKPPCKTEEEAIVIILDIKGRLIMK